MRQDLGIEAGVRRRDFLVVQPDDLLVLYTDGVSESEDESGEQLGLDRLLSIARNLPTQSAAAAGKGLLAAVAEFRGATAAADDETVVALQRRAGPNQ